jgi:hypothetical protein
LTGNDAIAARVAAIYRGVGISVSLVNRVGFRQRIDGPRWRDGTVDGVDLAGRPTASKPNEIFWQARRPRRKQLPQSPQKI